MEYKEYSAILHNKEEEYYLIKEIGEGVSSFVYLGINYKGKKHRECNKIIFK